MLSARVKLKAGERMIWEGKEYGEYLLSFLSSWNVQLLVE
jgi:hypothetical protein